MTLIAVVLTSRKPTFMRNVRKFGRTENKIKITNSRGWYCEFKAIIIVPLCVRDFSKLHQLIIHCKNIYIRDKNYYNKDRVKKYKYMAILL